MPGFEMKAKNMTQLLSAIRMERDPSYHGFLPVAIELWDGRLVLARYCSDCPDAEVDIRDRSGIVRDIAKLQRFVERLLNEGTTFVTCIGSDDMVCILRWQIIK